MGSVAGWTENPLGIRCLGCRAASAYFRFLAAHSIFLNEPLFFFLPLLGCTAF